MKHTDITQEELLKIIKYDKSSGYFTWIKPIKSKKKVYAGTEDAYGYCQISVNCKLYKAHRLAFLYVNGSLPTGEIDHIDGNPWNNSWSNLREVTRAQNVHNSKGTAAIHKNVYAVSGNRAKPYNVKFMINGKSKSFGYYVSIVEAVNVADKIRKQLHGEYCKILTKEYNGN